MGDRLDDLLGELAVGPGAGAPDDLEATVWRRLDTRQASATGRTSGVVVQCAIAACALLMGFSYQALQRSAAPADAAEPAFKLLGGTVVADAGNFQVLR